MGIIRIVLQDEDGAVEREVRGDTHLVDGVLQGFDRADSHCVQYIDPYGDTIFNRLQMAAFLREWSGLISMNPGGSTRAVLLEVAQLAEQCEASPHLYLRFYGD